MKQTLIGRFAVDSGQAMIGDPCYLDNWKPWNSEVDNFEDHINKVGEYGYLGACNATITNNYGELNQGSSVVFNTGWGDGVYPVYANIDDEGTIHSITVNFVNDQDEEQD
jgi:hypothetical protein